MRELKYRAWDKGDMIYFDLFNAYRSLRYNSSQLSGIAAQIEGPTWSKKNIPVMQYTGLKDKKGKKIYEGDVITFLHVPDKENVFSALCYGIVKFENGSFFIDDTEMCPYLGTISIEEIKGNIYENPELLK